MKKWLVSIWVFSCICIPLTGQNEKKPYLKEVGALSTLYRGTLPTQYPYQINGTYFWESKLFRSGSVYYNGKLYEDVLINVDASRQDLQVRVDNSTAPVVLIKDWVCYFTIGKSFFVNLNYLGHPEAPDGYFELVKDGDEPVFVQIKKVFTSRPGNHNGQEIGYIDPDYNDALVNYFAKQENYYTIEDGKVVKMKRRAFKKAMKTPAVGESFFKEPRWKGTDAPVAVAVEDIKLNGLGLPDGYFSESIQKEETSGPTTQINVSYRNKIYIVGTGNGNGPVKVSGKVTDLETGEPLPGVVIFDDNTSTYARSNAKGLYSISLPSGENVMHFSYEGKEEIDIRVNLKGDGSLNVELPEKVELLKASVVSAQSMANHRTTTMGVETVNIRTMSKIPSAFGEGDILKAVLTLPGVKTVGEASGGFNVRGGAQDQNLILFNGNTIYNPTHLFGIFSAFNPDIVEDVQLYKSSIPAQYGGRISSVLTVRSKEGSDERIQGSLGVGLLTSRLHLEGPLSRSKKTTFIAGGRITYSDWILKLLPANSHYNGGSAGFADANAGITHHFDSENSLTVNGYFATDRFAFSGDTTFRYTNINGSAQFRHRGKELFHQCRLRPLFQPDGHPQLGRRRIRPGHLYPPGFCAEQFLPSAGETRSGLWPGCGGICAGSGHHESFRRGIPCCVTQPETGICRRACHLCF